MTDRGGIMQTYTKQEIEQLRRQIIDYYGSAAPVFGIAMADVIRVQGMSDEEVLREARKLHLI